MGGGDTPQVPAIPVDPNLATEQADAEAELVTQTRVENQGDMAALMALYGSRLAMSGSVPSRAAASPSTSTRPL
jgi:hypothetical protein